MLYRTLLVVMTLSAGAAVAQATAPPQLPALTEQQKLRFPQPVRVGDLIGRDVLKPIEAQPILGRVVAVVRGKEGGLDVIVRYGGVLGFGSRPIAIPIGAMALMGEFMAVMDFTPAQLTTFPTNDGAGLQPIASDEIIRVGIVKPFH
jgi:hypothetical protein